MKIYCCGIGGIGLSAYAELQKVNGCDVSGSDRCESEITRRLQDNGIQVSFKQDGAFVPPDADLFVYSEAVPKDSPEILRAKELGILSKSYFTALGDLSRGKKVIAVCGTHGKSSTVAMSARVLLAEGFDPSVAAGTLLKEIGGLNWRSGMSEYFLIEACEYRRSFMRLSPSIILLTNADGDHFDAFDSVEDYQDAFVDFARLLPANGLLITHMGDSDCARIARKSESKVLNADDLVLPEVSVPGTHMRQNAQLVLGLAQTLGISRKCALESLKGYSGCWRRMEIIGELRDTTVIDDYAHHPSEIKSTIQAILAEYPNRNLVCLFQPHMHDRTFKLYSAFTKAFSGAHKLVLTDVYDARSDVEKDKVDMRRFAQDIGEGSAVETIYSGSLDETANLLGGKKLLKSNDVLLCMGAGDVSEMIRSIVVPIGG